jgi:hypothetical protein
MTIRAVAGFLVAMCGAVPAMAGVYEFPEDEDAAYFIQDEVIATFYHELGHALIDILGLPVLGREEDAADSLSVILMDDIWEEDSAAEILTSDALSYQLMAAQDAASGLDDLFADEHSLNIQRYYNVVCLFYGANPDERGKLADDLGLPDDRKDRCPQEYDQASASWDAVLQAADADADHPQPLSMARANTGEPLADLLTEEIKTLNEKISLPEQVVVRVADCGEANAFYNPEDRSITMCNEYAEYLQQLWEAE